MEITVHNMGKILIGIEKDLHTTITHEIIRKEAEKRLGIEIEPKNYKQAYVAGRKYQNRFNV